MRVLVVLLEAQRRCLLGPSCPPENQVVQDPHLCAHGIVEEICALSLHKENGFFWGTWMKVIPDALITLTKNLTEKTQSLLLSGIFSLLDKRKNKTLQAC